MNGPLLRRWGSVVLLLAAATLAALWLDQEVSLTSQAMLYLMAVVAISYRFGWLESVACAIGAVVAFNFYFVPPRHTLAVEHREHLIALLAMLTVGLLISHLATSLRRQAARAELNETRARQVQALATELAGATTESEVLAHGRAALRAAFTGPCVLALGDDRGEPIDASLLPEQTRDGLRCCIKEMAVLGPGTGRWPGLESWFVPLATGAHVVGAASIEPAVAADVESREHARTLCGLLAQAVWRLRLAASMLASDERWQRQHMQSTFLAAISHDLRTPLAAIVGAATSLQSQREHLSEEEQQRLLASIVDEATYLSTLTENTLQLVRLSGETLDLRRDWESMEEIVGSVLTRTRRRDPMRRISSRVPANLPLVKADPVLLAQLIGNLLDNALAYSDGPIDLSVRSRNGELLVCVNDRGPGLAPEAERTLFEPFVRNDRSPARGAGLGLAVCRAIALAHHGRLVMRRRKRGGSSFSLALPTEAQPALGEVR
jgi:two-component system sensor histidine kinase KdpD